MSKSKKTTTKSETKATKAQRKAAVDEVRAKDAAANAHAAPDPDRVPLSEVMKKPAAKGSKQPKASATPKAPTPAKEKKVSGLDAAFQVLTDTGAPMRCKDMVEKMISTGLWKSGGKTPAATIYSAILREITVKGAESRFKKSDRGLFIANA